MILEPHRVKTLKRRICSEGWEENEKKSSTAATHSACTETVLGKPALWVSVPGKRIKSFQLTDLRYGAGGKHEPRTRMLQAYQPQKFRRN